MDQDENKKKVLIVDDEPNVRRLLHCSLKSRKSCNQLHRRYNYRSTPCVFTNPIKSGGFLFAINFAGHRTNRCAVWIDATFRRLSSF